MLGGVYLCFEGAEKIWHAIAHRNTKDHSQTRALLEDSNVDLLSLEKERVKGAIRTDFILSLEIIVIALSTVQQAPFAKQAVVLSIVALGVTFAVYGLVAMIVKIDDLGLYFLKSATAAVKSLGGFLLWLAPVLMKTLTVVGTLAMFLVGGGILTHGVDHYIAFGVALSHLDVFSNAFANGLSQNIFNGLIGMLIGAAVVAVFTTASDKR
jgi:predicted DNA repair protein MutK